MVIADFYRVIGERLSHKGDIEKDGVLTLDEFAGFMMENPADFYYGVLWNLSLIPIFLGVIAAIKHDTVWDSLATVISVIGVSVPSYVFALALSYTLGFKICLLYTSFQKVLYKIR